MEQIYINAVVAILTILLCTFSGWYAKHTAQVKKLEAKNNAAGRSIDILGKLATYAVDLMETTGNDGETKLNGALAFVKSGLQTVGINNITTDMMKGAIETAVKTRKALAGELISNQAPITLTEIKDDTEDDKPLSDDAKAYEAFADKVKEYKENQDKVTA